ncbi:MULTISPECIES: transposase domain-containing protein [Vibrio]|uniref:transposase domain-containing protein n=1 Tax=Vibrio TaxID=662 RepID=UPI002074C9A2|nr:MULTISPECIES: transposase domain-containing protein [Vibrio]
MLSDKATIRRRRLPGDIVLWLIVGMAFFRNEPVARRMLVRRILTFQKHGK